jgi:hypothetical protein
MTSLTLFPMPVADDSSDAQCTPRTLALDLGDFDLDPCANPRSHIRARVRYMLEQGHDGLSLPWTGSVFVNPPYSAPLPWCERLRAHPGAWCALVKLDPTTRWWAQLMGAGAWWAPFRARLAFERAGNCGCADFPSALIWRGWTPPAAVLARLWSPRSEASSCG